MEYGGLILVLAIIHIETGFFLEFVLPGGDYMLIRTLVPMIAGATIFSLHKFLLTNILGAITWVGMLVPLGYFIGKAYPEVNKYSFYILLLFIAIASYPMLKIMLSKVKKS